MYVWMCIRKTEEEASDIVYEELYKEFVLGCSPIPMHANTMAQYAQRAVSDAVSAAQQAAQSAASANQHLQTQTQQQQFPPPPRMKPALATLQASAIFLSA